MGEFGDKFRKGREKKNLSFDDVSRVIKISSRMLKAIEEEHFEQLPGGIFNKGFIRTYAKHLGLNDEEAVSDYLECIRQEQIRAAEAMQTESAAAARPVPPNARRIAQSTKSAERTPSPVEVQELPDLQLPSVRDVRQRKEFLRDSRLEIPWSLVALAAAILCAAIFLWIRHSHSASTAAAPPSARTSSGTPQVPQQPSSPPTSTGNSATSPQAVQPKPSTQPSGTPASAPNSPRRAAETAGTNDVDRQASAPSSAQKSSATLRLVIRATENSWLSILADGQPIAQETLIAPAHTTILANHEIIVRVGNAAGVSFVFNGTVISAQGNESEVKTIVFDASGMRLPP